MKKILIGILLSIILLAPYISAVHYQYNYVIITTNAIVEESQKLDDFIQHKESMGFHVLVVTEDDFDHLEGEYPNERPDKIRQWLIDNYQQMDIEYVLLIGDPTPDTRDGKSILEQNQAYSIPMKTFEDTSQLIGRIVLLEPVFENPSDYYYADLDSNWNPIFKNTCGDAFDFATRQINMDAEVYVGRIPTYDNTIDGLDDILQRTMEYETDEDTSWHQSGLFAASFSSVIYDDALVWEQTIKDFAPKNFTIYRQYMQGSFHPLMNSIFESEEELRNNTVVNCLQHDSFGLVAIASHGSRNSTSIGCSSIGYDGKILTTETAKQIPDDNPSMFFIKSCTTGYPEGINLGYSLLKHTGVGVVCSSRETWYHMEPYFRYMPIDYGDCGMFYRIVGNALQGQPIGKALYDGKENISTLILFKIPAYKHCMNLMRTNLYGDPSIHLKITT